MGQHSYCEPIRQCIPKKLPDFVVQFENGILDFFGIQTVVAFVLICLKICICAKEDAQDRVF